MTTSQKELPVGWKWVKLGKIAEISYGHTASANAEKVGPQFLRITDIQDNAVDWNSVPYCEIDPLKENNYLLESGDIVFARTGATTGKSFLIKEPPLSVFASYLIRVRINDSEISRTFISNYFQTTQYWKYISRSATGSGQPGVNATKLSNLLVPLPPMEEQKRIAEILNKAEELKKLREEADRKTEELIPAIFHEMFGDSYRNENNFPTKKLSELVEVKGGGTPSKSHPEFWDGNIPWVSPKDMKQVDISNSQDHITGVAIKSSSAMLIPTNSVLIVTRSGVLKHTVPIALNSMPVTINQDLKAFVIGPLLEPQFLLYQLITREKELLSKVRMGATVHNFKTTDITNLDIVVPPITEQKEFVNRVSIAKELKNSQRISSSEISSNLMSMSQKAFRGEL